MLRMCIKTSVTKIKEYYYSGIICKREYELGLNQIFTLKLSLCTSKNTEILKKICNIIIKLLSRIRNSLFHK